MTPKELLNKLVMQTGPCMRMCSYCPEEYETAEIKECVEEMIRKEYVLKQINDDLMKEIIRIRSVYHKDTGKDLPLKINVEEGEENEDI